jgi:hypothetical protein
MVIQKITLSNLAATNQQSICWRGECIHLNSPLYIVYPHYSIGWAIEPSLHSREVINVRNMLYSQLRSPIQEIKHKQTTRIDRVLAVTTVRWPINLNCNFLDIIIEDVDKLQAWM